MYDFIYEQLEQFAYLSGIIGSVREHADMISIIMMAVGILLCLLGIYIYRYAAAIITFFAVAEMIIILWANRTSWGTIVTAFSVAGVFLAYYIWNAKYISAVILCWASIALYLINARTIEEVIGYIVLMIGCAFAVFSFPVESICISTTVIGTLLLRDLVAFNDRFLWMIAVVFGIALQLVLSKRQSLYDKRYPEWFTARIKKKEK